MKILRLEILDSNNNIIRDIRFKEFGISYIYGDIQEPDDFNLTINGLGKTLLLKFIDLIFGANIDNNFIKDEIKDYKLKAEVSKDDEKITIIRELQNKSKIYMNGEYYKLNEYKKILGIDRSLYDKQFILEKKPNEISKRSKTPSKDDIIIFLKLLQLDGIIDLVKQIHLLQDEFKNINKINNQAIKNCGIRNINDIGSEEFLLNKSIKEIKQNIKSISEKMKNIEVSDIKKNIMEEYSDKNNLLKKLKLKFEKGKIEYNRLDKFIEDSNKVDISSEHLMLIFEKAKQDIPDMVKRNIREVEIFHKKVYQEREMFLNNKKDEIFKELQQLNLQIDKLSEELDELGNVLSENNIYQELLSYYDKYNQELQEVKFKEGRLHQIKEMISNSNNIVKDITVLFEKLTSNMEFYKNKIATYREFVYDITKQIYDNIDAYFDIITIKENMIKVQRPIKIIFKLKGDACEGINEVKKNVIDYLILKYNNLLDIMIQDSSCYNGIDPRQVYNMLNEVSKIAIESNKQVIISINKYQLGNYEDEIDIIKNNSVLILSESDKLLKMEF